MTQLGDSPAPTGPAPLDDARLHQSARLIDHLIDHGPSTRTELATATGLGRTAVANLSARLAEAGILTEDGAASPGARPAPVALTAARHVLVTVAIDPDEVVATLAALDGAERARFAEPHTAADGAAVLLDLLATVLSRALAAAERADTPVADVTVLVDGAVAGTPPVAVEGTRLGSEPIDVLAELRARLPRLAEIESPQAVSVRLLPTAVAAAEAEAGALAARDLLYLDGDAGVASAVVADGRPLRGAHGLAASLAHLPIVPSGIRCDCGQRGCLLTVAGPEHVLDRAGLAEFDRTHGRRAALAELVARVDDADDRARWSWLDAALWIGRTLQVVVPTVDPAAIVVAGYWARLLPDLDTAFRENRPTIAGGAIGSIPPIVAATAGPDAALAGARRQARDLLVAEPGRLARLARLPPAPDASPRRDVVGSGG
ncbi:ROK family protein [Agromyces sp. G08B096]|uniref:ROK family protein n=1 Tax=Agromyces sp. G08B096 TaxID=3156399 RepID=A0AAU7W6J3_9MICO